jgi:outer membrane protein TolC
VPAPPDTAALRLSPPRLSLLDALRLAEGRSESGGIAQADVTRARGERRRARSVYFPQLTGTASYQRTLRSQFSVFRMTEDTTMAAPSRECARFTPQPSQTVDERLAALEDAVACSTASDPFASFRNLPFGRENTYRFGLSASQALFTGGRLVGIAEATLRQADTTLVQASLAKEVGNQS